MTRCLQRLAARLTAARDAIKFRARAEVFASLKPAADSFSGLSLAGAVQRPRRTHDQAR